MFKYKKFHGDFKCDNIVLYSDENTVFNKRHKIMLIDFGCATEDYNIINGYTPFYVPLQFIERLNKGI